MSRRNTRAPSPWAKLRHGFGSIVAAGPLALTLWLLLAAGVTVPSAAAVLHFGGMTGGSFIEALWISLTHLLAPAALAGHSDWPMRWTLLPVSLAGIVLFAGLVVAAGWGVRRIVAAQRSDRAPVFETGHIVILNWAPAIFDVIGELGRSGKERARIVVLADRDRMEMEDALARILPARTGVRVHCRRGDPAEPADLALARTAAASAVLVLPPENADADAQVARTLMALRRDGVRPIGGQITAAIRDRRNAAMVRRAAGDSGAQLVLGEEMQARLLVLAARQPGLGAVYGDLLDPSRVAIRILAQPSLEGSSFGDAMMAYGRAVLVGLTDPQGKVWLAPPMETTIRPGMKAILLARAGAAVEVSASPLNVDHTAIALYRRQEDSGARTLMLGWNRRGPSMALELSRHAAPGSLLTIAADTPDLARDAAALSIWGSNLQVEYGAVDVTSRAALEALDIPSYDQVLLLGDVDRDDARTADTRVLATLLHLRGIPGAADVRIVCEHVDARGSDIAGEIGASDYVAGNRITALMLAQAVANADAIPVFDDLLDEQGAEIVLRAATSYLEPGQPMSFYTVTEACRQRGEVALGHVQRRGGADGNGVTINPDKSQTVTYEDGDRIIVLARH